jgi:DNA-directed RNA polymerase subunit RPC12/RpoP
MAVDIVCPDCGGTIGGAGGEGRPGCSCVLAATVSKSDTVRIEVPLPADLNESKEKRCITCGKDVTGHRRIKDSRGYQCYSCAKSEMAAGREGTVRCAECSRRVKPAGLVEYGGIRICRKCFNDHKELKKKAVKKVATRHYELHERKNLIWMTVLFCILALLVLYSLLF